MRIDLNVLEHLGIGLYSNVPAVLSEAVANAWDAEASTMTVAMGEGSVVLEDDGVGMNLEDVNDRFLLVGYRRQREFGAKSKNGKREVMGRKGIGKLSLFGVADVIDVYTSDGSEQHSLRLDANAIRRAIDGKEEDYHPAKIPWEGDAFPHGTRLILRELRRDVVRSRRWLRQRVARRFSVIEESSQFSVIVDGSPLTPDDRGYFRFVDDIWYYGERSQRYSTLALRANLREKRVEKFAFEQREYEVTGWIGSVRETKDLIIGEDDANAITLFVRGKAAKEDILPETGNNGVFTSYLVGEIHADFLGDPEQKDIATTSRQDFNQEDPRYRALIDFLTHEVARIGTLWNAAREERGVTRAMEIEPVRLWYEELPEPIKRVAKVMFGKVNSIPTESGRSRLELYKLGVLGFERLRASEALDRLASVAPEALIALGSILSEMDDLEAALFYQLASMRFQFIRKLEDLVAEDAKEKVIQEHLFEHLWLLDPTWGQNTHNEYMERTVHTAYARLREEDKKSGADTGRVDIGYQCSGARHVVVELKAPAVLLSYRDVINQVTRYTDELRTILDDANLRGTIVTAYVILGRYPREWSGVNRQVAEDALRAAKIELRLYSELLERVHAEYGEYTEAHRRAGRIQKLLLEIDALMAEKPAASNPAVP